MNEHRRRPRSALAAVWILVVCAAVGTGVGLVVREVRSNGGGSKAIRVRPARPGPQSPAALWLFGVTTVRLDRTTLSDPRDAGFQGFGAVLGGDGVVYLYDQVTGRIGIVDATHNAVVGRTRVPVQGGEGADVAPVLAAQGGSLWLVGGPGRLTRYDVSSGATSDVTLPTDVVSAATAGGPPAAGATRVVADGDAAWAVYDLGVTGNPPHPAVARVSPDGTITARAALPDRVGEAALEPQALALGDGELWVVGRQAVVGVDATTLAVRHSFTVRSASAPDLHGAAVAGKLLWSYDSDTGALLGLGLDQGRVRHRLPLTGAPPRVPAPATIIADANVLWVRVRVGAANTLEQLVSRVNAATGDVTAQFDAPPALEVGEIAVSR